MSPEDAEVRAYDIDDMEDIIDPLLMQKRSGKHIAEALHLAGFRRIFDGDCGLSGVDPTDRDAVEAWMRWANLASRIGATEAMKQMLTELGYRKKKKP